ncbi:MAG: TrmH family RNA methyltransferase [Candidatus Absconditabacterales bacterium]
MKVVILENIRSAYNVGNIIRTADSLGRNIWLTGYSPSPIDNKKVSKTSLGAENNVGLKIFNNTIEAINFAKENKFLVIGAEITKESINLKEISKKIKSDKSIAVIFGNEVDGILKQTLNIVDYIVYIPMFGIKESLNVGQSSAIFMRELNKL